MSLVVELRGHKHTRKYRTSYKTMRFLKLIELPRGLYHKRPANVDWIINRKNYEVKNDN